MAVDALELHLEDVRTNNVIKASYKEQGPIPDKGNHFGSLRKGLKGLGFAGRLRPRGILCFYPISVMWRFRRTKLDYLVPPYMLYTHFPSVPVKLDTSSIGFKASQYPSVENELSRAHRDAGNPPLSAQ